MVLKSISDINQYTGTSVNPLNTPDITYELYSVPSFDQGFPEIIKGSDIGSTKITVEEGDILICKINPRINRVWVVKHHTSHQLLASSEWIVVRNKDLNSDYLKWYFESPHFRRLLTSQVAGIGGSLTRAQPKQVAKYLVPIPGKDKQLHISTVLNKLMDLISLRKQQLAKLDELVKARFMEILREDYPIVTAESVCLNIVDCPHSTPKYEGNELIYPAIRTSEINNGDIDWSSMKYVSYSEYLERTKRLAPLPGDIVYAREGTYGDCVVLPEGNQFCLGQRTMLFRPNKNKCTSSYLHQALRSDEVKKQADESNAGSTVPHVNVADAKKFKFPLPPLDLQHEFDLFTNYIDKTKLTIQQSLDKLEVLKKSLMQEYFG